MPKMRSFPIYFLFEYFGLKANKIKPYLTKLSETEQKTTLRHLGDELAIKQGRLKVFHKTNGICQIVSLPRRLVERVHFLITSAEEPNVRWARFGGRDRPAAKTIYRLNPFKERLNKRSLDHA